MARDGGFLGNVKLLIPIIAVAFLGSAGAGESEAGRYTGIAALEVGTDVRSVQPGQKFEIGVFFKHEPKYHTYWKAPGIVGVGATVEWKSPRGLVVGETRWPAPQTTLMANWIAYGYETDTTLVIPVQVPKTLTPEMLNEKGELVFKGQVGWMACATTCHPGWHEFEFSIPVASGQEPAGEGSAKWRKRFENSRSRYPRPAPDGWTFKAEEVDDDTITLVANAPENSDLDWSEVYFFSDDNQVNSHEPQKVKPLADGDGFRITLVRPDFAPENPRQLSGVLYRPGGWPGLDRPWMIAKAPW